MSNLSHLQLQVMNILDEWADKFACLSTVYVFGSFARGAENPNDIDVAVEYTDEVRERRDLNCYTKVNIGSADVEESVRAITPVPLGWTGLNVLLAGYDKKAWEAIRSGDELHRHGKVRMVRTEPYDKSSERS
jgi:hypothetical protein